MATAPEQPFCPLGSLTQSSAKTADFLVRVCHPKIVEYSYKGTKDGKLVEKAKFSCILLGEDAGHYCEASIKASTEEVAEALKKYKPNQFPDVKEMPFYPSESFRSAAVSN